MGREGSNGERGTRRPAGSARVCGDAGVRDAGTRGRGCAGTRVCGDAGVRGRGCAGTRVCGDAGVRGRGWAGTRVAGTRVGGDAGTRVGGDAGTRVAGGRGRGCAGTRGRGCAGTRGRGCAGTRGVGMRARAGCVCGRAAESARGGRKRGCAGRPDFAVRPGGGFAVRAGLRGPGGISRRRRDFLPRAGIFLGSAKLSLYDSSHLTAVAPAGKLEPEQLNFTHSTHT